MSVYPSSILGPSPQANQGVELSYLKREDLSSPRINIEKKRKENVKDGIKNCLTVFTKEENVKRFNFIVTTLINLGIITSIIFIWVQ